MSQPERLNKEVSGFNLINNYTSVICIIFVYFIIALVITYPLIFKINHYILGSFGGYRDLSWELWLEWFVKNSTGNLSSLYFTDIAHYPVGVSVLKDSANLLIPILSSMLQSIFKLTTSYNILCLLTLTLNGSGAYLLMRYLLKDRAVAFISGIIYAFNPYIITEISYGRLIQASAVWIPLYLLFLLKTFNENKLKNSILAVSFLVLTCLSSWYYGFFLIIFTIVFVLYHLIFDKNFGFASLKKITIIILLFGIMILPFLYPFIKSANTTQATAVSYVKFYSIAKVIPGSNPLHTSSVVRNSLEPDFPFRNSFQIAGISKKISILTLCLSFIPFFSMRKRPKFWVFSSAFFYILCLGPYLKTGKGIYEIQTTVIPLPYLFFYRFFPLFWILRWPGRFIIMLMLSLMVLAGNNLLWLFRRFKLAGWKKKLFSGILACLLILEIPLLSLVYKFPIPLSKSGVPQFYYELAQEKGCAIIQYPIFSVGAHGYYPKASIYGYYQTIHGKKTLTGPCDLTRLYQPGHREFMSNNSFIGFLLNLQKNPASPLNYRKEDIEALQKIGFKYLVVNNSLFNSKIIGTINDKLESIFGSGRVYSDGITVYRLE